MFAVVLSAALAAAAPAPVPKPAPTHAQAVVGNWVMLWGGVRGRALLGPRGDWQCWMPGNDGVGTCYEGTWSVKGDVLTLRERRLGDSGATDSDYTIPLEPLRRGVRGVKGKVNNGYEFRLTTK